MAHPSETRAPVVRAKEIVAGEPAAFGETLALTGLLERLGRSLERLEDAADHASKERALAALAAVSGQLHRGIEAAARIQGIGNVLSPAGGAGVFSVTINLDGGAAEPMRVIEGARAAVPYCEPLDA